MRNLFKKIVFFFAFFCTIGIQYSNAQTIELLAGNTLNGAMNGAILGSSTMALQNSTDFAPARVGLGFGTLYGIGVGVYDVAQTPADEQFYITGTFNDGTNSSIIVLLDTFYGAAAGAIVASSVTLITNEPIVEGLQYGSAAGAWLGFGFGLIDAFSLSSNDESQMSQQSSSHQSSGIMTVKSKDSDIKAGFINPSYQAFKTLDRQSLHQKSKFNLEVLNLSIRI